MRATRSWAFIGALLLLSAALAILQYRWIDEVSRAERDRMQASLESGLRRIAGEFNTELSAACAAAAEPGDRSQPRSKLIRAVWIATPAPAGVSLQSVDPQTGELRAVEWPEAWQPIRERMQARLSGSPPFFAGRGFSAAAPPDLVEVPRFRFEGQPARPPESEWALVQLDTDYIGRVAIPELLQRNLAGEYQFQLAVADHPEDRIYPAASVNGRADAATRILDVRPERPHGFGWRRGGGAPGAMADRGRWVLSVRHRAGSLESVVQRARLHNLLVTTSLFLLLLGAMAALLHFTRRAQRLAELQMEFVAGVSHELRTPLSVMRTAGHNLRGRMAEDPGRVHRYGELIEQEAEKLTGIVEQVLRFANTNAGRTTGPLGPVAVAGLIEEALEADRRTIESSGCEVDKRVAEGLPAVLGDASTLKHALQNLIGNAAKYGREGNWIGVSAEQDNSSVVIRVADRGPGIPADETSHIFDPFFRGRDAVAAQIHGTGLGLSLVKRIVEAHHGSIAVHSAPGKGTEFVLRLPAAPAEQRHEVANTAG